MGETDRDRGTDTIEIEKRQPGGATDIETDAIEIEKRQPETRERPT